MLAAHRDVLSRLMFGNRLICSPIPRSYLAQSESPPKEVLQNPFLIPTDPEVVVYCTCPGDETSRRVLARALAMHLCRIKLLKGGLAGWKAKGYSVVPYEKSFHLDVSDTPRTAHDGVKT